jgi:hypothetical protein
MAPKSMTGIAVIIPCAIQPAYGNPIVMMSNGAFKKGMVNRRTFPSIYPKIIHMDRFIDCFTSILLQDFTVFMIPDIDPTIINSTVMTTSPIKPAMILPGGDHGMPQRVG